MESKSNAQIIIDKESIYVCKELFGKLSFFSNILKCVTENSDTDCPVIYKLDHVELCQSVDQTISTDMPTDESIIMNHRDFDPYLSFINIKSLKVVDECLRGKKTHFINVKEQQDLIHLIKYIATEVEGKKVTNYISFDNKLLETNIDFLFYLNRNKRIKYFLERMRLSTQSIIREYLDRFKIKYVPFDVKKHSIYYVQPKVLVLNDQKKMVSTYIHKNTDLILIGKTKKIPKDGNIVFSACEECVKQNKSPILTTVKQTKKCFYCKKISTDSIECIFFDNYEMTPKYFMTDPSLSIGTNSFSIISKIRTVQKD